MVLSVAQPGTDPLKALVEAFLDTWQYAAADPERGISMAGSSFCTAIPDPPQTHAVESCG